MNILIIVNDAPYGTEKAYNALRLGTQLLKDDPQTSVNLFLLADAVGCAVDGQITPNGYYNIERMIKLFTSKGGRIKACGSCMDARGIKEEMMLRSTEKSTMSELARWTVAADKVISF